MKKLILVLLFLTGLVVWYGESRNYVCENNKCVTVWKTFNNTCYVLPYKYYGLLKPSRNDNFIKTTNTSAGVDLIWQDLDTILVQVDEGSKIFNGNMKKGYIKDYKLDEKHNDSLYTYFDNKLNVSRYKKNIDLITVSINNMGAL